MIRKRTNKNQWAVFSHKTGKRISGWLPSRTAAAKRLGEIKGFASRAPKRGKMY